MGEPRRPDRVAEAIREGVATFLAEGAKDPRIRGFVTVTAVDVTRDLRHATVFVSVMGDDAARKSTFEGLLRPEQREVILGEAEVRELFKVPKIGMIAGCFVRNGVINRQGRVRLIRDGVQVYDGTIGSLRRFKDDVREVREGFECGIGIENFNDVKVGDVIENYRTEEIARTLKPTETADR